MTREILARDARFEKVFSSAKFVYPFRQMILLESDSSFQSNTNYIFIVSHVKMSLKMTLGADRKGIRQH